MPAGDASSDRSSRDRLGRWRSEDARRLFEALEDERWRAAPGPRPEAIDVATGFDMTRAPFACARLARRALLLWGPPGLMGARAPAPIRRWLARRLRNPLLADKTAAHLLLHSMVHHAPGYPLFGPLTDAELQSIRVPVV